MKKIDTYNSVLNEARKDAGRLAREAEERIELEEELTYVKLRKVNLITKDHKLDRELKKI